MSEAEYKKKYMRYKRKYLELKQKYVQMGGDPNKLEKELRLNLVESPINNSVMIKKKLKL